MGTPVARAELVRESLPYSSSPTGTEWALITPLLPVSSRTGRPWRRPLRVIPDGIQYVLRTGCAWRHLPLDFPLCSTVHRRFLRLSKAGVFERPAHALTLAARSGGVGVAGERGYDPARRVVGRKRHALTDTEGRLLLAQCFADQAYQGARGGGR